MSKSTGVPSDLLSVSLDISDFELIKDLMEAGSIVMNTIAEI